MIVMDDVKVAASRLVPIHSNHDCGNNSKMFNENNNNESPNDIVNNIELEVVFLL